MKRDHMSDTPSKGDKDNSEWREELSSDQYRIAREEGTERAFTSPLNNEKRKGD